MEGSQSSVVVEQEATACDRCHAREERCEPPLDGLLIGFILRHKQPFY